MEKIISIKEIEGHEVDGYDYESFSGFVIETDKRKIYCLIEDRTKCCESWGYLWTNEDKNDFIGSSIFNIEVVDGDFDKLDIDKGFLKNRDEYNYTYCVFINFNTSNGLFQLVAYNNHNGYYGHNVLIFEERNGKENILDIKEI